MSYLMVFITLFGMLLGASVVILFGLVRLSDKYDRLLDHYIRDLEAFQETLNILSKELEALKLPSNDRLTKLIQDGHGPKTVEELIDHWT